jgi:hypothetical protein
MTGVVTCFVSKMQGRSEKESLETDNLLLKLPNFDKRNFIKESLLWHIHRKTNCDQNKRTEQKRMALANICAYGDSSTASNVMQLSLKLTRQRSCDDNVIKTKTVVNPCNEDDEDDDHGDVDHEDVLGKLYYYMKGNMIVMTFNVP